MADESILEMREVSKTFPGVRALDRVSFSIQRGEVHAIVGENGAGKSTLMRILAGVLPASSGTVLLEGNPVTIANTRKAIGLGMILINQELSVAENLTVTENVFLGSELHTLGILRRERMRNAVAEILDLLGASFSPDAIVGDLSLAEQQQVELARALHHKSRVLIMDEPTASLSERETEKLFEVVRSLKQRGITIIFISHRLSEILAIADSVSVLRDGEYIGTLRGAEIAHDTIVRWMVGRELTDYYQHETGNPTTRDTLVAEHYGDGRLIKDVSFFVGAGEILCLAGLVGAGRTELCRLLFGVDKKRHGQLRIEGAPVQIRGPRDAIRCGIGYVPEDRKTQGLFLGMSAEWNIAMNVPRRIASCGILRRQRMRRLAQSAVARLKIAAPSVDQEVAYLSGGNQQKVLLSRWLEIRPKVLILDEPTRGIDVGAKSEIFKIIGSLVKQGVAVVFVSSDLAEVIGIAQRILVMREGRIVTELRDPARFTQEEVVAYATGLKPDDYIYSRKAG
jgi:ribose transport system ATP-binding protein